MNGFIISRSDFLARGVVYASHDVVLPAVLLCLSAGRRKVPRYEDTGASGGRSGWQASSRSSGNEFQRGGCEGNTTLQCTDGPCRGDERSAAYVSGVHPI